MKNGPYELVVAPDDFPGMKYRGRYCYEHTLVFWRHHGVVPADGECIHHIDGDTRNNTVQNLMLTTRSDHGSMHGRKRVHVPCGTCGDLREMTPSAYKWRKARSKHGKVFCSRSCASKYQWRVG